MAATTRLKGTIHRRTTDFIYRISCNLVMFVGLIAADMIFVPLEGRTSHSAEHIKNRELISSMTFVIQMYKSRKKGVMWEAYHRLKVDHCST